MYYNRKKTLSTHLIFRKIVKTQIIGKILFNFAKISRINFKIRQKR